MKPTLALFGLVLLLIFAFSPVAAQVEPRATINASVNNNAENAYGFNPDAQITVTGAESATIQGSEPTHSCLGSPSAGGYSVWFTTVLAKGTVTLDTSGSTFTTAGGPSTDTVISIYRFTDANPEGYNGFGELTPVACNDGAGTAGVISNLAIGYTDTFYIQVSAAPSVVATGASTIVLTANFTATKTHPYDEPAKAKKIKLPNLPGISNIDSATISLTEPVDPHLVGPITNTVWAKFTLTSTRVVGFQNFYYNAGSLFFSLFTKSGGSYVPATGAIISFPDIYLATLNPGTYFLRIGVVGEPAGTDSTFITYTGIPYLMPANYNFSVGFTEGIVGATPDFTGWTMKNGTSGPGGDGVFCDGDASHDCYFQFVSAGATEKTQIKANVKLKDVTLKKGDVIRLQPSLSDITGTPNFTATLVLTNSAGKTQTYTLSVTDGTNTEPNLTANVPAAFTPVKATITFKNKDKDLGDLVQIDGIVIAALRIGAGVRDVPNAPLFHGFTTSFNSTSQGVLPLPAAPQ